jgi:CheY-like chemotaxis protein
MSSNAATLRVLLVEDHYATRTALTIWLTDLGHEVLAVDSFSAALIAAAGWPFDVLLSDIGLPDGNGRDLVRRLRQTHRFRAIAISGLVIGPSERELSRSAGFLAHLEKPFNPMDLERSLHAVAS